jgi:hypothetical protein
VVREYQIQWENKGISLAELAKLRWVKRWSIFKIARHYEWTYYQTRGRLKRLAKHGRAYRALDDKTKKIVDKGFKHRERRIL